MSLPRAMGRPSRAFTLIELMVVIAIIALLIGILLPALGKVRNTVKMVDEQVALNQLLVGYNSYTNQYKDRTIPAAPHWNWVHQSNYATMYPPDPFVPGAFMWHTIAKVWTWHFIGAIGYQQDRMMIDKATYQEFRSRPLDQASAGQFTDYGGSSYTAAMAYHPSFGLNGVYVGGAYTEGAFRSGWPGPNPRVSGGEFYVSDVAKVRYNEKLIVFASSRGGDCREGGEWSWGEMPPDPTSPACVVRPGYFMVEPPRPHPSNRGFGPNDPYTLGHGWGSTTDNAWNPSRPPSYWGNLNARHFGKVTTGFFDGHVQMQTLEELRDMRKWSNYADRPDWNFVPAS